MSNDIVTVNVTTIEAATPSKLQKMGAVISQGGTSLTSGDYQLITEETDLSGIIVAASANASLTWASSVVTVETSAAHGVTSGTSFRVVISGVTPDGFNGAFLATSTGSDTFTYPLTTEPDSDTASVVGTWQFESAVELTQLETTWYAQNYASTTSFYVLELGAGSTSDGVTALDTFETSNPTLFYSYLVPRAWADESTYVTFVKSYTSNTSKKYFFTTVDADNYTDFASTKSVVALQEAPALDDTDSTSEFTHAADWLVTLHYTPSSTNKVTPFSFSYVYDVTNYPTKNNSTYLSTLKSAYVNYIDTGAEGGLSDLILKWGTTMDGKDFNYWYSVDWVQINCKQTIATTIIEGSNTSTNPLNFNQSGINRLQDAVASKMSDGQEYGLVLGDVVKTTLTSDELADAIDEGTYENQTIVNAVPFTDYCSANSTHYALGEYDGLTVVYIPATGFRSITFNIEVTQLVTA